MIHLAKAINASFPYATITITNKKTRNTYVFHDCISLGDENIYEIYHSVDGKIAEFKSSDFSVQYEWTSKRERSN